MGKMRVLNTTVPAGSTTLDKFSDVFPHLIDPNLVLPNAAIVDTFAEATLVSISAHVPGINTPGNAYSSLVGGHNVTGGVAQPTAGSGENLSKITAGFADGTVEALVKTGSQDGLVARLTDNNNYIRAVATCTGGSKGYFIYKKVAGAVTQLGTLADATLAVGQFKRMRLVLAGTAIKLYVDGVLKVSVTESFNQTATQVGFINKDSNAGSVDDFQVST